MADKRLKDLTAQATISDDLLVEVDDAAFSESKNVTVEQINEDTRAGAGLDTDGSYAGHSGSNYLDAATDLHNADELLDAQVKSNADDIATNADDIADLEAAIQHATVTIISADVIRMDTAQELIAAPSSGYIDVISIVVKNNYNSAPYTGGDTLKIISATTETAHIFETGSDIFTAEAALVKKLTPVENGKLNSREGIYAIVDNAPASGDSSFTFYITYRNIDV
jgi:hypothetical protein